MNKKEQCRLQPKLRYGLADNVKELGITKRHEKESSSPMNQCEGQVPGYDSLERYPNIEQNLPETKSRHGYL